MSAQPSDGNWAVTVMVVSTAVPIIGAALILPSGTWREAWLYGSMLVLFLAIIAIGNRWHR